MSKASEHDRANAGGFLSAPSRQPARRLIKARAERLGTPWVSHVLAGAANIPTILKLGWEESLLPEQALQVTQVAILGLYLVVLAAAVGRLSDRPARRRELLQITRPEQVCAALGILLGWWALGPKIAAGGLLVVHLSRLYVSLTQTRIPAGLMFLGSFLALALAGTLALLMPSATPAGKPISVVDALFTICSAMSQTGLTVRETGEGFTRLGQVIILAWIQLGALGVIVFGALLATVIGQSFGLRATQTLGVGAEQGWEGQLSTQRLVTFIIIFTHAIELMGAVVLYFAWPATWEGAPADFEPGLDRFYHCLFFSVSAFCNAGFVTTSGSMVGLAMHWTTHVLIAGLIFVGSIGFPVLDNLRRVVTAKIRGVRVENGALVRLSLNSRLVLVTMGLMYLFGFGMVLVDLLRDTDESVLRAILDAHFMSVNRTAGFSSLEAADEHVLVHLGYMFLMAVGGAPASVAGGIKVMVVAVLAMMTWSTLLGREKTTCFGREIPDVVVRKSSTLALLWMAALLITVGTITALEAGGGHDLRDLLFEATSAYATCGLSSGVSKDLTDVGKIVLSVAMFVGRIGPFALLAGLLAATARRRVRVEYPTEDVIIY